MQREGKMRTKLPLYLIMFYLSSNFLGCGKNMLHDEKKARTKSDLIVSQKPIGQTAETSSVSSEIEATKNSESTVKD